MSRRKKLVTGWIIVSVLGLMATGYVLRDRLGGSAPVVAADSTRSDSGGDQDEDKDKKEPERVPVEVSVASPRDMYRYYSTTATLEPDRRVDLYTRIEGTVAQLLVEEGETVRAGQVLCRLHDREQKIALEDARIKRDQSQREYERLKKMHDRELVSEKEYDDVENAYELARNAWESAKLRADWTVIRAPFDGILIERVVELGAHVSPAVKLFSVADIDPLELVMYLPESAIGSIRDGQKIVITPDAGGDRSFEGEIVRIAPEVDRGTGTVKVTAVTHGNGLPGSFARVRIVTGLRPGTLAVPRRSVVVNSGEKFVFVARADSVERVDVLTGLEDEEYAEITEGVVEGDSVVTSGVGALKHGARIRVVDPHPDTLTRGR